MQTAPKYFIFLGTILGPHIRFSLLLYHAWLVHTVKNVQKWLWFVVETAWRSGQKVTSERSLYWGHFASIGLDPIFAFITASSLHGIKLSSCSKHFSEILDHALMMPFHSRYWFVNCTSKTHLVARRCSLGLDPSLRWFGICDISVLFCWKLKICTTWS